MGTTEVSHVRRLVGELVRVHRGRAGFTQKSAAQKLLISESLMGAVERAERIPSNDLLVAADELFEANGALKDCSDMLDEEKYPPKFVGWAKSERTARIINGYETMVVPGLLQTEAYAYALHRVRMPAYTEAEVVGRVEARLERQSVLTRTPPPHIGYVIEESVLERCLGGQEVLKEQLQHMLDCIERYQHLTVQVMPTAQPSHAGLWGSFQLLSTEGGRGLVYVESRGGDRYISQPDQVIDTFDLFGILRGQAHNPWTSAEIIEKKMRQL
ncbi:Scr1 family TA system antitoxin-like transcriptional regulator [Streptomyces sp. NPDC086838]|uniref:helix-turn-helix domain-containing protein n=1 Tax=Streptomyces sp. NPDC086838 TaxID=3365762 RepID=UPI00380BDD0D